MLQKIKNIAHKRLLFVPPHLLKNHIQIDQSGFNKIQKSLEENYHTGWRSQSDVSKKSAEGERNAHLRTRLESDRRHIVPWLDDVSPLQNKRILEIGCGTGCSAVALAEQGAKVTTIDIDEGALRVAKDRFEVYGVDVKSQTLNANKIKHTFGTQAFDMIIFFASLEHMSVAERLSALEQAWEMLPNAGGGGELIIIETPNRLWYYDWHTSMLPFYQWLPDELAFKYSKFSPRETFNALFREYNPDSKEQFIRRGRGMSFHELEVAIGAKSLKIASSLAEFERNHNIMWGLLKKLSRPRQTKIERRYKSLLMAICPNVHEGFFEPSLDLIIKNK